MCIRDSHTGEHARNGKRDALGLIDVDAHGLGRVRVFPHGTNPQAQRRAKQQIPDHKHREKGQVRNDVVAGNNLPQNRNILDERDIHGGHHFAAQRGRYAAHAGERKQEKHRSAAAQKVDGDTGQDIVCLLYTSRCV